MTTPTTAEKDSLSASKQTRRPHKIIRPSQGWFALNLRELWSYRELFFILALREIQLRYRQTLLGVTWVILQPLLTTAIFSLIFGRLMNVSSENLPYELFAFAGMLPWALFSQSIQRAGASLTRDIRLVTRVFFPRIIIPVANAASTVIDFLVTFIMLIVLFVLYETPLSGNVIVLPLLLLVNALLAIGVGLWFAALNVYYRDFTYALPFVLQAWMYASPLVYSSEIIPESWSWIYALNPMVGVIDSFRWATFGTIPFPTQSFIYSLLVGTALLVSGTVVFRKVERTFADVI
jgi:lipopolysaccharide transport system permease protein